MSSELGITITRLFNLGKDNSSIPVTSSYDLLSLVKNQNGLVELLDASIDLINTCFDANRGKFELSVSSKGERCRWVEVMGAW